ncbi:hypothetical protein [Carboxylicivirga taeanensis]|uniref:hypothetical protein n=1 Tax=Carboxylicivirga taeanensis TaxID=1416875 RepID=UPI003F6E22B0
MKTVVKTNQYTIGGIGIQVNFLCPLFDFDTLGGSHHFARPGTAEAPQWTINYRLTDSIQTENFETLFTGSEAFDAATPYKWSVIKTEMNEAIYIEFEEDSMIKRVLACVDTKQQVIAVSLCLQKQAPIKIDPFLHPLGVLMLQYLAHYNGGFIIHASTIAYKNKGYLFSAVSGTGKSTMAELWRQKGATIINDDRLIILPDGDKFRAWNTPMPYYQDKCKSVALHKAFIIKQSPNNYLRKLSVIQGTLGLLGNCMQFQYDSEQVQNRLNCLQAVAQKCEVFECGFKPDKDIVELILAEVG